LVGFWAWILRNNFWDNCTFEIHNSKNLRINQELQRN
jgi:hypothetical protein